MSSRQDLDLRAGERGQGTVEWVGMVCVVCLLLVGVLATGLAVSGVDLARTVATRMLCAVELADGCGDEPLLIATYGDEIGRLVWRHCRRSASRTGSPGRADRLPPLPRDRMRRRARRWACPPHRPAPAGDLVRPRRRLPGGGAGGERSGGDDCSDERAGRLYLQYWLFYANSAGLISSKPRNRFSSISRLFGDLAGPQDRPVSR